MSNNNNRPNNRGGREGEGWILLDANSSIRLFRLPTPFPSSIPKRTKKIQNQSGITRKDSISIALYSMNDERIYFRGLLTSFYPRYYITRRYHTTRLSKNSGRNRNEKRIASSLPPPDPNRPSTPPPSPSTHLSIPYGSRV